MYVKNEQKGGYETQNDGNGALFFASRILQSARAYETLNPGLLMVETNKTSSTKFVLFS